MKSQLVADIVHAWRDGSTSVSHDSTLRASTAKRMTNLAGCCYFTSGTGDDHHLQQANREIIFHKSCFSSSRKKPCVGDPAQSGRSGTVVRNNRRVVTIDPT